jgi:hypothetical protein
LRAAELEYVLIDAAAMESCDARGALPYEEGTVRLQDQADAAALRECFNLKDEDR